MCVVTQLVNQFAYRRENKRKKRKKIIISGKRLEIEVLNKVIKQTSEPDLL